MSLQYNTNILGSTKKYNLATVIEFILQDVVKNGKKVLQKYSIRCKLKNSDCIQTRRYYGDPKFISIPKNNQYVYVLLTQDGYFWTKRFDSTSQSNIGLDYDRGNTIVSGSNHDVIVLNGKDEKSNIGIVSISTKDSEYGIIQRKGQSGQVYLTSSKQVVQSSKNIKILASQKISLLGLQSISRSSNKKVNISGKEGVYIINDIDGQKAQRMVLGDKLVSWCNDLMDQVGSFLGDLITQAQTGIGRAGPTGPRARAKFGAIMTIKKQLFLQKNKNSVKTFLSKNNKVD